MRLKVTGLAGERGGEQVFSGVDFDLSAGDCLIATGENGAGKSTMLRVIAGLLPPAGGSISFEGGGEEWPDLQSACHFLGEKNAMKDALSVADNLSFRQKFLGNPFHTVEEALDAVNLPTVADLPFGYLSTGQRRRVAIAGLLVSFRPVWLLDEPTAGLDLGSERRFSDLMRGHLADDGIIIAATHVPLGIEGARTLDMGAQPSPPHGGG
ncbi:MAG: heme ABC exporter ATP-binding protein CcmA [Mesorhizobium sp.]